MKKRTPRQIAESLPTSVLKELIASKEPPPPPSQEEQQKNAITELLEHAGRLPNEELAQFVQSKKAQLRELEILNIKKNVTGVSFVKSELDALLNVFETLAPEVKAELGLKAQRVAHAFGLPATELSNFVHKLIRLGLHG